MGDHAKGLGDMAGVLISLVALSLPPFRVSACRCGWEDLGQRNKRTLAARDPRPRGCVEGALLREGCIRCVWRAGDEGEGDR